MGNGSSASGSKGWDTSLSLLERAKARDGDAWGKLSRLYGPLVYRWARQSGLQAHDSMDVVQNVFVTVASDIVRFRSSQPGDSFRGWLWTICRHKILDRFRERQQQILAVGGSAARQRLEQVTLPEPGPEETNGARCRLRHRALGLLREQFDEHTWQAFLRTFIHGDRSADVARDLGISVATVNRAKFRVLKRLRAEFERL